MINVHLIRTDSVSNMLYDEVAILLSQFSGPMKYRTDSEYAEFLEEEISEIYITKKDFYKAKEITEIPITEHYQQAYMPKFIEEVTWPTIFTKCRDYRKKKKLKADEMVVLLTNMRNDKNWFSAGDPNGDNNFFIQTDSWEYYTHAKPGFPVAYLIATAILKKQMFADYNELAKHVHNQPRGCISDFCENKRDITLKLRTADICDDCLAVIKVKGISSDLFLQCTRLMEHIRSQILFRDRFEVAQLPSRIAITRWREPIQFLDMDGAQLRLSPLEKTVFMLFLENPKGIPFYRMSAYRDRLEEIYMTIGHNLTLANLKNTMDNLTNPIENRLSEIASRIKSKIISHVGNDMATHYTIDGPNGGLKRIKLDRCLVVWEGIQPVEGEPE